MTFAEGIRESPAQNRFDCVEDLIALKIYNGGPQRLIGNGSFQVIPGVSQNEGRLLILQDHWQGVSQNEGRLLILQDHWHAGQEVHKTRPPVPQDYKNAESGSPKLPTLLIFILEYIKMIVLPI
ncbi:hypothetical protein NPIL_23541 [Nephila pilipes]|uniref:Uncharacterized protein n=1 Tax=Nephila pilipes TaxID=299642 RepID=A0A8X6PZP7_NEPPI|nr:hypothetical protein NPIL_23541 [Nephila pilipes]